MAPPPNKSSNKSKASKPNTKQNNKPQKATHNGGSPSKPKQKKEKKQKVLMEDSKAMLQLAESISDTLTEKVQQKQRAEKIKWAKIESKEEKKQQQKEKRKQLLHNMIAEAQNDTESNPPVSTSNKRKQTDSNDSPSKKVRFSAGKK
mmetsp:Transcript_21379/g.29917  ORF Transcript_21379/g.29917 Transcript_21379/m.29917 type:complete len:147 (-) Transcript_21379:22-462(-)